MYMYVCMHQAGGFMCVHAGNTFSGCLDLGAWQNVNLTCIALLDSNNSNSNNYIDYSEEAADIIFP